MASLVRRSSAVVFFSRNNLCGSFGLVSVSQNRHGSSGASGGDMFREKRGKGGRSSFSGIVATVFGASGNLGTSMVNRLGKIGSQVVVPYRQDPYFVRHAKLSGDLGQILYHPYDLRDEESLRTAMSYSNVVVNCIGREYETKNFSFKDIHVDGPRRMARLARDSGVQKFIHLSTLNAMPNPPTFWTKGGSQYLKTKYEGELAVREEFPEAIIFRPADIFGRYDRFLRYYVNWWRRVMFSKRTIYLYKNGNATTKMPVYYSDICEGITNAILNPGSDGKTYDCVGPDRYFLSDLVEWFYKILRNEDVLIRGHQHMSLLFKAHMVQALSPRETALNVDKLEREYISDIIPTNPTLADLGVNLTPIEEHANRELTQYKSYLFIPTNIGKWTLPPDPKKYTDYPEDRPAYY